MVSWVGQTQFLSQQDHSSLGSAEDHFCTKYKQQNDKMKKYKKSKIKKLSFFSKVINENCCIIYILTLGTYESHCTIAEIPPKSSATTM